MNNSLLGIYPDAMDNATEKAENLTKEAAEVLKHLGHEAEADDFSLKSLQDNALAYLEENGSFSDITNSVIAAYFSEVTDNINNCIPLNDLGISANYDVNCDDSHIILDTPQGTILYHDGELSDAVNDIMIERYADKLSEMIDKHLEGTGKEYPKDWVNEDLRGETDYTIEDVRISIENGKLNGSILHSVDTYSKPVENEEHALINDVNVHCNDYDFQVMTDDDGKDFLNMEMSLTDAIYKELYDRTDLASTIGSYDELSGDNGDMFYTYLNHYEDGSMDVVLLISRDDGDTERIVPMSDEEKAVFLKAAQEFMETFDGTTIEQVWAEHNEEKAKSNKSKETIERD